MKTISKILKQIHYPLLHFMVSDTLMPKTWGQHYAWVKLYRLFDLSYIVNMIEFRLPYGMKFKNSY